MPVIPKPAPEVIPKYNAEDQHIPSTCAYRSLTEGSLRLKLLSPKLRAEADLSDKS